MTTLLITIGCVFFLFWRLHTNYIAVMALKDLRDEARRTGLSQMTFLDKVFGYPTLIEGYIEDCICNMLLTFVLLEFPKELTVTARTKRLAILPKDARCLNAWRRLVSRWLLGQIAHHDKAGGHDVPDDSKIAEAKGR
jgi:hypothetical protein